MNPEGRVSGWAIALLITSLLGILLAGAAALLFAAITIGLALRGEPSVELPSWTVMGLLTVAGALGGSAYHAGRVLLGGRPGPPTRASPRWALPLVTYPVFLAAGYLAVNQGVAPALLGPIGLLGTAVLPVIFVVGMVRSQGPPVTRLRSTGQFAVGLTWMPGAALAAEVALLVPLLVALAVWMASTVEGAALLGVMNEISPADPDAAAELLAPAIRAPGIVLGMYAYIGLVVPAVEEAIKTMAVWPLLRRRISASEAFLGGALGGAGYALFEALFLTQPGEAWLVSTLARAGATLLHVFTAGLTSWGLVTALRIRRPLFLIGAYTASVAMHAAWNLSALTLGLASIPVDASSLGLVSAGLSLAMLALLTMVSLGGLLAVWAPLARSAPEVDP